MSLALRVLLIFMALVSTYSMLKKIKKFKMQIEYAIFWVIFSVALIIMAIYPKIFDIASKILGVYSPANLVFAFIIFILLVKFFNDSGIIKFRDESKRVNTRNCFGTIEKNRGKFDKYQ